MKKEQGITLVSLVVTIIVLIILAGVSINLLLGQNGIITIAKQAKENMQLAQVEEQEELNELYSQISEEGSGSTSYDSIAKLVEFKREIASAISDMGIATSEDASAETMANNIRSFASSLNAVSINYDNTNSKLTATNVQSAVDELDTEVDAINSSLTELSSSLSIKSYDFSITTNGYGNTSEIFTGEHIILSVIGDADPSSFIIIPYKDHVLGNWHFHCLYAADNKPVVNKTITGTLFYV